MDTDTSPDWQRSAARLFGSDWIAPLADVLHCSRRTIERWRDGKSPIPDDIVAMLDAGIPTGVRSRTYGIGVLRRAANGETAADMRRDAEEMLAAIAAFEKRLASGDVLAVKASGREG